ALSSLIGFHCVRADEPIAITTVTGTVTDDTSKHPVAHAEILFSNTTDSEKATTESASDGTFTVTLPVGTYQLTVRARGFETATREGVVISDQPVSVQIGLVVSGNLKTIASVTVRTQSIINVTPAAINTMTAQQIEAQGSIGLSRVLSEIPGVQITMAAAGQEGGAFGYEYAADSPANPIYIGFRGSQPYENATLFDGHRINSADWLTASSGGQAGVFNLAQLDTNSISSLDVVKGP